MNIEFFADHLHDDIVEIVFGSNLWMVLDVEQQRALFGAIHRRIGIRMEQLHQEQIKDMHRQFARVLECERGRMLARVRKVFTS